MIREALLQAIQTAPGADRPALYRALEAIELLEVGRWAEAAARVLIRDPESLRRAEEAIRRLEDEGYQVALHRDREGYLALALRAEDVVYHVVAESPERALTWLAGILAGVPAPGRDLWDGRSR